MDEQIPIAGSFRGLLIRMGIPLNGYFQNYTNYYINYAKEICWDRNLIDAIKYTEISYSNKQNPPLGFIFISKTIEKYKQNGLYPLLPADV